MLSLADQVCLAVIGERRTHGWAIVKLLHTDGELGRIWSLSRPLTYRSIDRLVDLGLIDRSDAGRRAELRITAAGRRVRRLWLDTPVEHLRDMRTVFLLKLALRIRSGIETTELVKNQQRQLAPAIAALTRCEPVDVVDRWRQESARAVQRFLDQV